MSSLAVNTLDLASLNIYRAIFDNCQFGLIVVNQAQRIVAWNPWVAKHSNLTSEHVQGKLLNEIFPMIADSNLQRSLSVALSHGMSAVVSHTLNPNPLPLFNLTGEPLDQQIKLKPLEIGKGNRLCLIQITDITAAVKRDKQLLEHIEETLSVSRRLSQEKERAQVTLDSIADAVITTDANGNILSMNPVAEQLIGIAEVEGIGTSCSAIFTLIDEHHQQSVPCPVSACLKQLSTVANAKDHLLVANGRHYAITYSVAPVSNTDGTLLGTVVVFSDETKSRALSAELNWQALHDPLTGLANRRAFELRMHELQDHARTQEQTHYLFYMDLDQFKVVNDTCGHDAGDELLKQVAILFLQKLRKSDLLARLGGDEFGVLLESCEQPAALKIAQSMQKAIEEYRFAWHSQLFKIGVSIGIATVTGNETKAAEILSAADSACYVAKESGRNRIHFHESDESGSSVQQQEMQWISKIQHALDQNGFVLYVQRIQSLHDNTTATPHYEVLVRMYNGKNALIPPGAFLPAAERFNLMAAIDRRVIDQIFATLCDKREALPLFSINLSGMSISDDNLLGHVLGWLKDHPHLAKHLCFEITETAAISNINKAIHFLASLREKGCSVALDDFGSGLSSFAYLKRLPIDFLKIDGYFVRGMIDDPINCTFVETIHQIGRVMGLKTIAEFVETDAIAATLAELGVDYGQGYGLHVPCPLHDIL